MISKTKKHRHFDEALQLQSKSSQCAKKQKLSTLRVTEILRIEFVAKKPE